MSGPLLDTGADVRSRHVKALTEREEAPARSLTRIAEAVERVSPPPGTYERLRPGEFEPRLALAVFALRSCPDPELIVRVPDRFFEPVDQVAVVWCPCDWVPVAQQGWTVCEGCGRGYLWTGERLYAVRAATAVDVQDRCDHREFVAVEGSRPRCQDCGIAA